MGRQNSGILGFPQKMAINIPKTLQYYQQIAFCSNLAYSKAPISQLKLSLLWGGKGLFQFTLSQLNFIPTRINPNWCVLFGEKKSHSLFIKSNHIKGFRSMFLNPCTNWVIFIQYILFLICSWLFIIYCKIKSTAYFRVPESFCFYVMIIK